MNTTKLSIAAVMVFALGSSAAVARADGDAPKKAAVPFKSSIQAPEDKDAPKPTTDEQKKAEEARLLALAKVTPDEAKAAGMAVYDGDFKYVKIHNYAGNLAYEVEFKDGLEIIIDAGNKAVLQLRIEKGSAFDKARTDVGK
jgi:uncharacterized membrane protein YkoI